jgi:hypothetical protein
MATISPLCLERKFAAQAHLFGGVEEFPAELVPHARSSTVVAEHRLLQGSLNHFKLAPCLKLEQTTFKTRP